LELRTDSPVELELRETFGQPRDASQSRLGREMTKRVLVLLWTEAEWTKALEWPETCRGPGTAMGVGEVVPQDDLAGNFDATH
jgi:hypothetical protein